MNFREFLNNNIVFLDGGMGTLLQARGLMPGEHPEMWNITHADVITDIHRAYFDAGSNVVCTNTFGANIIKFCENDLEAIIKAAVSNAMQAREKSTSEQPKFIALDIGPTGKLLKPLGDLDFEDAVEVFAKTVRIGTKCGVDLIIIETMNDSYETKAALLAAKENSNLPVIVSNAYEEDGKLMTGASPAAMVAMLEGMGADAIGANCSLGPIQLRPVVEELLKCASVPVILKPNAGLPKEDNGKTVFDIKPQAFSQEIREDIKKGVRVVGGCCGTTPEYIKAVVDIALDIDVQNLTDKNLTVVSSYSHAVTFGEAPILIGERINPTGKKRLRQALVENDIGYILNEGSGQQEKGVHILDVNVGITDINEEQMLKEVVSNLQAVINLPLQIDTANVQAMEQALRIYNGKALINSVNGKKDSMNAIFPLVKKYGGVVVALTLDENGIPDTCEGRVDIAKKIIETAQNYGVDKKNIIFDTLAMTVSADNKAAITTLQALKQIKEECGCHTSLGVSNVSFGLPNREAINSTFFAMALENGLDAAIMNPYSADMMRTYYSYMALSNRDENCLNYIQMAPQFALCQQGIDNTKQTQTQDNQDRSALQQAIIKGFKDKARELTTQLILTCPALDIVNNDVIPALDIVGQGFESKKMFLPQLLMSAEAAKSAFDVIKANLSTGEKKAPKATFVIATVYGDIHDIGKNIVKLILENYGYDVVDLGKNVPPDVIVKKVQELHSPFVGLSALMTTTVPYMEQTIQQLRNDAPWCKIVVGGAVLTEEYAKKIGADKYAQDAMETVRYAEEITSK